MPTHLEGFGRLVETARIEKAYSRERLGELAGVSSKHIYNIEHKAAVPSVPLLLELIRILELPPERVLYPTTCGDESMVEAVRRSVRALDERELAIVKDLIGSLLRNRRRG